MISATDGGGPDSQLLEVWAAGRDQRPVRRTELLLAAGGVEPSPDLPLGAVDAWLLDVREDVFGSRVELVVDCPACGQVLQVAFNVADLRAGSSGPVASEQSSAGGDVRVRFRSPTLADLRAIEAADSIESARLLLLRRCVTDARRDGVRIDAASLPEELVARIGEAMAAAERQADMRLGLRCPECDHAWDPPFDIAAFLWLEVDARMRHLLVDIHTLARAYGWTEADILALPPARRQAYLELVFG